MAGIVVYICLLRATLRYTYLYSSCIYNWYYYINQSINQNSLLISGGKLCLYNSLQKKNKQKGLSTDVVEVT